jgi:hypothetical protein
MKEGPGDWPPEVSKPQQHSRADSGPTPIKKKYQKLFGQIRVLRNPNRLLGKV